jgi:flagellar hook assembly protein FlgD
LNIALSVSAKNSGPRTTRLEQNYPNPFNPATTIAYELASSGEVSLRIYDILGREIRTLVSGQQEEGRHVVQWDGLGDDQNPVSTGIYYCQLVTTDGGKTRTSVRKMTIME